MSEHHDEKRPRTDRSSESSEELDITLLHEAHAGRLVVDPEEAKIEFGESFASRLKLNRAGTKVLWPQPLDSPDDPQNVCAVFWNRLSELSESV